MIGERPLKHETWWSLERTIVWIASEGRFEQSNAITQNLPDVFDPIAFFQAMTALRYALIDGIIKGYGSLDTAPSAEIFSTIWIGMKFDLRWHEKRLPIWGQRSPTSILALSKEHYRAAALLDLSQPSGDTLNNEPGYYRVISELHFRASEVIANFSVTPQKSASRTEVKRRKGPLRERVVSELAMMSHKGQSLSNSPCGLPLATIAREIEKRWLKRGEKVPELDNLRKTVERVYDDVEDAPDERPMSESEFVSGRDTAIVRTIRA